LSKGIRALAQGVSGNTQNLIEQLRKNSKSVLLGTSSMWEGIDVRGDALQVVIVTRLPFEVPTDPIYQARSDRYKNGFMEYGVPGAIMRFRQGFGRLIRSSNDRGVFIVVDNRIFKNNYGHKFTESLPTMRVEKCESKSLGDHIKHWLNQSKPQ
jgi:Rad3-related DNA helicase